MTYLSAQPDDYYFLSPLQLFNFSKLGISPKESNVLIRYSAKKGLSKEFETFCCQNKHASIFFIWMNEKEGHFSSWSHIIPKHFRKYPDLEK